MPYAHKHCALALWWDHGKPGRKTLGRRPGCRWLFYMATGKEDVCRPVCGLVCQVTTFTGQARLWPCITLPDAVPAQLEKVFARALVYLFFRIVGFFHHFINAADDEPEH